MKATKKIIPALVMLLVSAVLLSTASYAWFSMNATVTATGMQVTAKVPDSLQISVTDADSNFGSTVALVNDGSISSLSEAIVPTRHTATTGSTGLPTFYKLTDDAAASVNEHGKLTGDHANASLDNQATYTVTNADFFVDQMWLKLEGVANQEKAVNVKVEWDGLPVADSIKTALHILFVDETGKLLLDWDMSYSTDQEPVDSRTLAGFTLSTATSTTDESSTEITPAVAKSIYAYAYLAGDDDECKNVNISANDLLKVTITFGVEPVSET
ncbi:MAG: hypothetical protein GX148_01405 [Clostridiales bacterium]|jgi:hypothetical protein|nr:hypothetical protein [Clostridiales bacterium]